MSIGRVPSICTVTALLTPGLLSRPDRNRALGLGTASKPFSFIENTPTSSKAPYLFLWARINLQQHKVLFKEACHTGF